MLYIQGRGIPKNALAAAEIFRKLALRGDRKAQSMLDSVPELWNLLLAQDWPQSHIQLRQDCQYSILQVLLSVKFEPHLLPDELATILIQYIIQVWPTTAKADEEEDVGITERDPA